jgi:benzodiazapine receptor
MTPKTGATPAMRPALALLLAVGPVVAAAALGNIATIPNIPTWYAGLVKPSFNPPNWIFGPVWTTLYVMMAYAFYRVLRAPAAATARRAAVIAFLVQIALNAGWSWAFFAAHSPLGGLLVIGPLLVAIAATIVAFRRVDAGAAWLLAPYLAWVSFASVLNAAVWRLNA